MKRKSIKIICIIIAVLAIGAVIGWVIASGLNTTNISESTNSDSAKESLQPGSNTTDTTDEPVNTDTPERISPETPRAPSITADEASLLSSRLTSRNIDEAKLAWVNGAAPDVAPTGTTIAFDVATFYSEGSFARMNGDITIPGQSAQTWRFLLQYIDGQWLVYTSEAV